MTKIKTVSELIKAFENKQNLFEEINGRKYNLNFILVLQKPLINIMTRIKQGKLYYNNEH